MFEANYGVWSSNDGRCHGTDLTRAQAIAVSGRCERLIRMHGPFFVGTTEQARALGYRDHRGFPL